MVHGLVHAATVSDEPEVDDPERGDDLADDPGLLSDLTDGGVLGGLALLDVALREGPEEAAAAVGAADQGSTRPGHAVLGHHQAPGRGLVDPAQPAAGASTRARPSHDRRVARAVALPWLVVSDTPSRRPPVETARRPPVEPARRPPV